MIRSVAWMLVAGLLSLSGMDAWAQETTRTTASPATGSAADGRARAPAPPPGSVTARQPLPPARDAVQRGQRSFKRCNDEALIRKYRGAERRHFVTRCRLGYGRRLFRRGAPPA